MKISQSKLVDLVSEKLTDQNVGQIAQELWHRFQKEKKLGQIDLFIDELGQKTAQTAGRVLAKVVSSKQLSQTETDEVKTKLEQKFQKKVDLDISIDPEIIGGLKIKIGDDIYDLSYLGQIQALKQKLQGGL
jgi:F-type H+-transporting ATPase subunit delta